MDISSLLQFRPYGGEICWRPSLESFHLDPGFFKHLRSQIIGIPFFVNDPFDPRVDKHFRTNDTGVVGAVERGPSDRHSMIGGLNDGIQLSMETTAEFMSFSRGDGFLFPKTTDLETVF
jgi:hypothetical protein